MSGYLGSTPQKKSLFSGMRPRQIAAYIAALPTLEERREALSTVGDYEGMVRHHLQNLWRRKKHEHD